MNTNDIENKKPCNANALQGFLLRVEDGARTHDLRNHNPTL